MGWTLLDVRCNQILFLWGEVESELPLHYLAPSPRLFRLYLITPAISEAISRL